MKKKNNGATIYILLNIFATFLILGVVFSVALFFIGYHSADLGHNVIVVDKINNSSLTDTSLGNNVATGTEMYMQGMREMVISFFMLFAFTLPLTKYIKYL